MGINPAQLVLDWPSAWPLSAAAGLLGMLAVLRIYLPTLHDMRQSARWLLPTLRAIALIALSLALLKPTLIRAAPQQPGAILLLLDCSASMASNEGESPEQFVALADSLGFLPPGVRDPGLQSLRHNVVTLRDSLDDLLKTRAELDYARESGNSADAARQKVNQSNDQFRSALRDVENSSAATQPTTSAPLAQILRFRSNPDRLASSGAIAALLRWVDQSQMEADRQLYHSDPPVQSACDHLAAMNPLQRTEQSLVQPNSGLLWRLPNEGTVFGYSIDEQAWPVPLVVNGQPVPAIGVMVLGNKGKSGKVLFDDSDLSAPVHSAIDQITGWDIDAIVIFSDGRDLSPAVFQNGPPVYLVSAKNRPSMAMRRLTESTGGAAMTLDELPTLPQTISSHRRTISREASFALWDSPYLFALVVGCLATEWAMRKRAGLA